MIKRQYLINVMLLMEKLIMKWKQKAKIMKIMSSIPMGGIL